MTRGKFNNEGMVTMTSYWPPFKDLYTYIDHLKVEIGSSAVGRVTDELKEFFELYKPWLVLGLAGFKQRSGDDIDSIQSIKIPVFVRDSLSGFVRSDGTKEVSIDSKMRLAAKEVSMYLDMEGHQALYLVHSWMEESVSDDSGRKRQRDAMLSDDGHVTMQQLASMSQMYCEERLNLLRSLEDILWIGEETVDSPVRDTIEGLIEDMLKAEKDTEEVTVSVLVQTLNTRDSPAQKAIIMGKGKDYSLYNWAEIVVQGKEAECTRLVSILMLLYYRPRKQCTADRFVQLLGVFRQHLLDTGISKGHKNFQKLVRGCCLLRTCIRARLVSVCLMYVCRVCCCC